MVSAVTHDEINVSFDSFLLKNLAQKSYFSTVKYIYIYIYCKWQRFPPYVQLPEWWILKSLDI